MVFVTSSLYPIDDEEVLQICFSSHKCWYEARESFYGKITRFAISITLATYSADLSRQGPSRIS